ncbi:MAG: hypothetical protein ACREJ0_10560 [Geminicoccaceae bacterium]
MPGRGAGLLDRRASFSTGRSGSALLAVLMSLALTALAAAGLLLVARREVRMSGSAADVLRVRIAAESATRAAIAAWDRSTLPAIGRAAPVPLPAGQLSMPGWILTRATGARIGPALWLVRGEADVQRNGGVVARATAAAMVVSIAPELPWRAFPSAIASASDVLLDPSAVIDGTAAPAVPPPWSAAECPATAAAAGSTLFGSATRPAVLLGQGATVSGSGALVTGAPPVLASPAADTLALDWLGPLSFVELAAAADRIETGAVSPGPPPRAFPCDTLAPDNWGAPLDPAHPCSDFFPVIHAPAGLAVGPGAGQGILLVDGDLDLGPGSIFYGAIVVRGRLRANGAIVHGAVRFAGTSAGLAIRVFASDCALWRAFSLAPALRRAWRPPGRWWLPPR